MASPPAITFLGTILFFYVWVAILAVTSGGTNHLLERVGVEKQLKPTLWLFIGVQILLVFIEGREILGQSKSRIFQSYLSRLAPLLSPSLAIVSFVTILMGMAGIMDGATG